jgi:hypothetical protein
MSIAQAIADINTAIRKGDESVTAFRATVTAVDGGLISIIRDGFTAADTEKYASVTRFPLAVNDVVMCLPLGVAGKPVIIDVIRRTAGVYPAADSPRLYASGTTTAPAGSPDASTTSTTTYATAFSDTWTLPAGTWAVYGFGSCSFIHSGSGAVDFYVETNGGGALTRTPNISSSVYTRWDDHVSGASVSSDGSTGTTIKLLYRSNTAGTTTPQAPKIVLTAYRTA